VLDTDTGKVIAKIPCVGEADDMFYDEARKRIYVTGDEGFISIIAQADADHYEPMAKLRIPGRARGIRFSCRSWIVFLLRSLVKGKKRQKS
jgi:hypothetical protein